MNRFDDTAFVSRLSMNFDDNDEPRRAINYDSDDQKLAPAGDLGINANDVLCGRGKTSFNHVGNRRFRHIISESIDDYNSAGSRKAKSAVVKKVHDNIRATGGRFLKLDSSQRMWVELSQQRSLEKVSHAIRDATSTNENMKKKKQKVHTTIAQVAAHVTSRFPAVHLEGKLDDDEDDEEHLAFKSFDSMHMSMPALPAARHIASASSPRPDSPDASSIRSASARLESSLLREERSMPPLQHQMHREEGVMPPLHQPTRLHFPEEELLHHPIHHRSSSRPLIREEGPPQERPPQQRQLQRQRAHHTQEPPQQRQAQHHEDDFVSYINEVLGPVSPADLDIDPLKKLAKRKKKDND